ncbi:hypothetical protein CMK11_17340 [Candidatus Poribacteria bacterium]|nr:hypothetical protein [Candidatus Poribacteria bacterium]
MRRPSVNAKLSRHATARPRIRAAVMPLGALLVVANTYWIGMESEVAYSLFTLVNPFLNAIFTLLMLIVANALLTRYRPTWALNAGEMLVIYVMVTAVSTISGATMMTSLLGTLAHPFWYADAENEWRSLFWPHIPDWFTVSDQSALRGYFEGESTLYTPAHLRAWALPVLVWSGVTVCLYVSLLCLTALVRRQWIEREKLTYPVTALPLAMTTSPTFFNTKLMWLGFGIAAGIRALATAHDFIPSLPSVPFGLRLDAYLTEKPWNAMGFLWMSYNPAIVGLTYFIPLGLSFSCWFFFWLTRWERVVASLFGWRELYLDERATGAWLGIGALAVWMSRRHLIAVARHIANGPKLEETDEALPFRVTVGILVASVVGMVVFCSLAGMALWAVAGFFAIFYALAIALARVRAELGPPYHELIRINPREFMVDTFGSRLLRAPNLMGMTFLYGYNRCNRAHPMPAQIEAFKMAERSKTSPRRVFQAIVLATIVGAVATFWAYLDITYRYGVNGTLNGWIRHSGWESFRPLQGWIQNPQGPDGVRTTFMWLGFAFVSALYVLRARFVWWPLHPSGYVLSGAAWGGMIYFWFPVMVSWLIKWLLIKQRGLGAYRKGIPFFLGLILGEYLLRAGISLTSLIFHIDMPSKVGGITGW